jgi:hypothetical protein
MSFFQALQSHSHIGQVKERETAHLVCSLAPKQRVLQVACSGGIRIDGNFKAPDQRFPRGSGDAHMRVKTNQENIAHRIRE